SLRCHCTRQYNENYYHSVPCGIPGRHILMPVAESATRQQVHALYHDHHGWLQGWLRKKLDNSFDAADLAHDTFMRLLSREEMIAPQEPRAFLTTVAKGLVANFYRRRDVEAAWLAALAALPEPEVPDVETRAILLET